MRGEGGTFTRKLKGPPSPLNNFGFPLSPPLQRYSESSVMAMGMVMTERMVDRLTSSAPKEASVL